MDAVWKIKYSLKKKNLFLRRRFYDANNPDPAETTKTDPPRLSIGDICRL